MDRLLNISQAAKEIGVTRAAISHAVKKGLIPYEQHGPYALITMSAALHYKYNRPAIGRPKRK